MLSPEVPEPPDAGAPQTVTIVPLAYIATGTDFTSPGERVMPSYHPRPSSGAAMTGLTEAIAVLSYSSTSTAIRVPGGIPPISPWPSERWNHFSIGAKCGARTRIRIRSAGSVAYDGARTDACVAAAAAGGDG